MDTVFANGIEAIFGFSLVLLHNNEEAILKLKFDQILEYLKSPLFDSYKASPWQNVCERSRSNPQLVDSQQRDDPRRPTIPRR